MQFDDPLSNPLRFQLSVAPDRGPWEAATVVVGRHRVQVDESPVSRLRHPYPLDAALQSPSDHLQRLLAPAGYINGLAERMGSRSGLVAFYWVVAAAVPRADRHGPCSASDLLQHIHQQRVHFVAAAVGAGHLRKREIGPEVCLPGIWCPRHFFFLPFGPVIHAATVAMMAVMPPSMNCISRSWVPY